LQKRKARLILDQDPIAPSEPLFKQLGGWVLNKESNIINIFLFQNV
jgi:hypothetical protein